MDNELPTLNTDQIYTQKPHQVTITPMNRGQWHKLMRLKQLREDTHGDARNSDEGYLLKYVSGSRVGEARTGNNWCTKEDFTKYFITDGVTNG